VYVAEAIPNHRISQFTATGGFVRTWGADVVTGGATGTGTTSTTTNPSQITSVVTTSKAFVVGQAITGANIPAGTRITAVGADTITMSQAATGSGSVAITAPTGSENTPVNEQQTVTVTATGGNFRLAYTTPNPSPTTAVNNTTANIAFDATAAQVQAALEALGNIGAGNVAVSSPNPTGGPYTVTFQGTRFADTNVAAMTVVAGSPNPLTGGTATVATVREGASGLEVCTVAAECKAGFAGAGAGQLNVPMGLAVDQSNGYVYATSSNNRRVDVFSGTGQFAGAFGFDVLPGDPNPSGPDFCTTATGCQAAAAAGANAGRFGANTPFARPAVDPSTPGRVFVPDPGNLRMAQYSTTITAGVLTAVSFDKAFGWDVIPGGTVGLESCTTGTTCQAGQTTAGGNNPGQFTASSPTSVAVDSTGAIYATSGPLAANGTCSAATPCRVQKFTPDASAAATFGPGSGPGQLTFETGITNEVAGLDLAVDLDNDHLFVLRKETPTTYRVVEYDNTGTHVETHPSGAAITTSSTTNTTALGLAIGTADRVYTNMAQSGTGQVFILGPIDPPGVTIDPVSDIESTTATFTGTVTIPAPGSPTFNTKYRFEYTKNGVVWTAIPVPDANVADGSTGTHTVSQAVIDLDPDTLYQVRLVATTGPSATSSTVVFTTPPVPPTPPRIALAYAEEITQTSARLGAHIDPEGLSTSYHFEWGPTPAYGTNVPAFDRQVGAGDQVVVAQEPIEGLAAQTTYHYRVIAKNSAGTTTGPDQRFETLNSCGLTDGRCYELVSPADKGPVALAGGSALLGAGLRFQAAPEGPGIAYQMAYGLDDSLTGNDVLHKADRDGTGWSSTQLDAPALDVTNTPGAGRMSQPYALSRDLSCGVYASPLALAEDAPTGALDQGQSNLYRRNPDGSWTTISNLEPQQLGGDSWVVVGVVPGASGQCDRVVFTTEYKFTGLSSAGVRGLYEWVDGTLRNVGVIPGPSGPVVASVAPGASAESLEFSSNPSYGTNSFLNVVSSDGSRIFFTATRQASALAAELGKRSVFVRENGTTTVDVSKSQTAVPNDGLTRYEMASKDGEHVFFTARYGLAANSVSGGPTSCDVTLSGPNGAGCALYRYSVDSGVLTDLSVAESGVSNSAGAGVAGVLAASDDGSRVYFAARGQLIAGRGDTQPANLAAGTYNLYLSESASSDETLRFVGKVAGGGVGRSPFVSRFTDATGGGYWSSRVTSDGRRLLFETEVNVTGYDSGGPGEAYLYDADTDTMVCVSCRRDRQLSVGSASANRLSSAMVAGNLLVPPVSLTADGERVFFTSPNRLAVGATEGRPNVYQWENGQISFLASSPHGAPGAGEGVAFVGASDSGDDVYFTTINRMTWQDTDAKLDVYDARVGGGFALPAPIPTPCDPLADGVCSGDGGASGVESKVETRGGSGDGNAVSVRNSLVLGRVSLAQRRRVARSGVFDLRVRTSKAGLVRVVASGRVGRRTRRVAVASKRVGAAGVARVRVRLSFAAVRALRSGRALRLNVRVTQAGVRARTATVRLPGASS